MVQLVYSKAVHILEQLCSTISMLDEAENWDEVKIRVHLILSQVNKLVHDYHQAAQSKLMFSLEKVLSEGCLNLIQQMTSQSPRVTIMIALLDKIQCSFRKLIVEMLAQEITVCLSLLQNSELKWTTLEDCYLSSSGFVFIQNIVMILEEPGNEQILRQAVNNVSAIGVQGTEMCAIIAESGGIRGLLSVILEKKYRFLKAQAVRALATICCVPLAINELEKVSLKILTGVCRLTILFPIK